MIFGDMQDGHDRRVEQILAKQHRKVEAGEEAGSEAERSLMLVNFNLVGIRRRLNNIEMGVWALVIIAAAYMYRHW